MPNVQYRLKSELYLSRTDVPRSAIPQVTSAVPVNTIFMVDCSGSMSCDLPKLRTHIKEVLPGLVRPHDTATLIWFSGRGEAGVIFRDRKLRDLHDLKEACDLVDRFLRPVGLTGFLDPLVLAASIADENRSKGVYTSAIFLSDGHDNCTLNRDQILDTALAIRPNMAMVVEYGYLADRDLLNRMALNWGASYVFARDFNACAADLNRHVCRAVGAAQAAPVSVKSIAFGVTFGAPFAVVHKETSIVPLACKLFTVEAPADVETIWTLSRYPAKDYPVEALGPHLDAVPALYAAMSLFAFQGGASIVEAILDHLGDIRLRRQFDGCFGKQQYADFAAEAKAAAFDINRRYKDGKGPAVPQDDRFTIFNLLALLQDSASLKLNHEMFKYRPISRKAVDADALFSADEQTKIDELTESLKNAPPKEVKRISLELADLINKKRAPLIFRERRDGTSTPIKKLVYNSTRANVSVLVQKHGTIDLFGRLVDAPPQVKKELAGEANAFPTFIFRNYAVVCDGIVNTETLVAGNGSSQSTLLQALESETYGGRGEKDWFGPADNNRDGDVVIHADRIPVLNRADVKPVSAEVFFRKHFNLKRLQARFKILNAFADEMGAMDPEALEEEASKATVGWPSSYSKATIDWLAEQGITSKGGFAPPKRVAPVTDFYMAKKVEVKFKGYSTLPSLEKWREMVAKGKLNGPGSLMSEAIVPYTIAFSPTSALTVRKDAESTRMAVRRHQAQVAQWTFAIVLAKMWPTGLGAEGKYVFEDSQRGSVEGVLELAEEKVDL